MSANSPIKKYAMRLEDAESIQKNEFFKRDNRCRIVRYVVATISGIAAVIYFLIGFNFIPVLEASSSQMFGIFAGVAYAYGALALLTARDRALWIFGAILQVFAIYIYFSIAPQRIPSFETWGVVLQILQIAIFVGLLYLIARTPHPTSKAERS